MALKGEREIVWDDIKGTCESVAEPGVGLCYKTTGSGIGMGDSRNKYDLYANPSGQKPAGILMTNVVNIDLTRFHVNFLKDEVQKGNPVRTLKQGRLVTNMISGTPAMGDTAYLTTNGNFTPTVSSTGGTAATPKMGMFDTPKDADGYAAVLVGLPIV